MPLISTHKGVYVWLKRAGYIGKRSKPEIVNRIINDYKVKTGNEFHFWTFFPNRTSNGKFEQSKREFNQFVQWYLKNINN